MGEGQWGREEGLEILFYLETGASVSLTSRACFTEGCLQSSQVQGVWEGPKGLGKSTPVV